MKFPRAFLVILILCAAVLVSACSGTAGNTSWPGVSVDSSTAYVAYGTQLYAINLDSGSQKWAYPAKADASMTFYTAPALTADGQLIVPSYNHKLYSIDPATGSDKWKFEAATDLYVASPLVTSSAIFAPNADGVLYAIDLKGSQMWTYKTGQHLWATPAYQESCDCLYQPSMDRHIYALNAKTGQLIWKSADLEGAMVARPTLGPDGTLYIGTFKGEMLAIDSTSGQVRWRFQAGGWIFSGAVLDGDSLYFGDMKGNLYGLNASTGVQLWTKTVGDATTPNAIVSTPVLKDGTLYLSTETETIYAITTTGTQSWMRTMPAKIYAPIQLGGGNLLLALNDANAPLKSVSPTGVDVWTFSLKK